VKEKLGVFFLEKSRKKVNETLFAKKTKESRENKKILSKQNEENGAHDYVTREDHKGFPHGFLFSEDARDRYGLDKKKPNLRVIRPSFYLR
jgi:hypothetical protein